MGPLTGSDVSTARGALDVAEMLQQRCSEWRAAPLGRVHHFRGPDP